MTPSRRITVRFTITALAVALLAAACGDDGGSTDAEASGTLRPFSEVQASDFVFEADPTSPGRGIFRVTTTEPMICAIVWGESEEFGNFNNSLAMNGTGIVEHDVFLPGAEPGTEYYFRVQGSAANGRQYRSETATFTIAEPAPGSAPASEATGEPLSLDAATVEASSEFSDAWAAVNAVDGDPATEWSTAGDGDDGWITVDLGAPTEVGGVEFVTRSMADGTAITETFTVSVDGGAPLGPFPAGNLVDPRFAMLELTGQELRFDVDTSTGGNVGAVEIRVFGP